LSCTKTKLLACVLAAVQVLAFCHCWKFGTTPCVENSSPVAGAAEVFVAGQDGHSDELPTASCPGHNAPKPDGVGSNLNFLAASVPAQLFARDPGLSALVLPMSSDASPPDPGPGRCLPLLI
jgi:hypothetical protein